MAATDGVRVSGRWQRLMVYEPLGGGVRASGRWQRLMVYEPLGGGSD